MIDSAEVLKSICNYSNSPKDPLGSKLVYFESHLEEWEAWQIKQKTQHRDLTLAVLLEGGGLNHFREDSPQDITPPEGLIKTIQINLVSKKFISWDAILEEVVGFLNLKTQEPKDWASGRGHRLDLELYQDHQQDVESIIQRVRLCSHIISLDGAIGQATAVIWGTKFIPYLSQSDLDPGIRGFWSPLLDEDKIIICRANLIDFPGLVLIDNTQWGHYFFTQTPNWQKQFCWFKIKTKND